MKNWHRAKENKMWLRVIIAPTWEHLESTLVDWEHTFAMAIQNYFDDESIKRVITLQINLDGESESMNPNY